jgi:hypothetical protein
MKRFSRWFVSAVAVSMLASPISAQRSGGGGGGLVGGIVGGIGGAVGGTINRVGSTVGGPVGGTISSVGGTVGGITGTLGGVTNRVGGALVGSGGLLGRTTGALGGSLTSMFTTPGALGGIESLDFVNAPEVLQYVSATEIENYREARLAALIAANSATLDRDFNGMPVRKHELIATNPDPISLSAAVHTGFRVIGYEQEAGLGIRLVTLSIPRKMNVRRAMKTIRDAAPGLQVDFNHIYEPSGGALLPVAGAVLAGSRHSTRAVRPRTRIAMIDGGVASHPSLARASIVQQAFAGRAQATGHGTAVGSLLVGDQGPFRGAARGAQLFVADVYGGNPAAGSTTSILRALNWAASKNPSVINISLVGPDNKALAKAIAGIRARGIQIVAAVGNDGPAAPLQYPASYPGVVSVTGVDAHGRALREAGRAAHLDFAAPGADMVAAFPGNGYTPVRGTSFAAPLAAARLAIAGSYQRLAQEARPGEGKVGHGIVCVDCRVSPKLLRK